ncbi:MAG TPA: alpha/beta fold hydrolase [Gemmatimonadales bacterium]|nr:alpha/beta fold hydrolase [Gemmatimonadales bacterium]
MRRFALFWALALPTAEAGQQVERVEADSLRAFDGRARAVERRTLVLHEADPRGGAPVRLEVVYQRLPSRSRVAKSPIVFFMGGPGVPASLIGRIPPYWTLFDRLSDERDVILLDQRGTGLSTPSLSCPAGPPPEPGLFRSNAALREALRVTYARCLGGHSADGAAPQLFTVEAVARDVDVIRRQLGARRVSLLGFSFGTRLALRYIQDFPERVDQVVLQGILGPEDGVRLPSTMDSILARVSRAAARDSTARALVPDLSAAIGERVSALRYAPVQVTVPGAGADSVRLTIGAEGFLAIVTGRLGDPRLPALLASLRDGDTRLLGIFAGSTYRDLASGGGSLFGILMYCSATGSEGRFRRASLEAPGSLLGEVFDNLPTAPGFCRDVGLDPGRAEDLPAQLIPGPALLVSGSLDDRTPPANAERARVYFARSRTVLVENGGHELLPDERIQALVAGFFASGRVPAGRLTFEPPRFLTLEEALLPPRRR